MSDRRDRERRPYTLYRARPRLLARLTERGERDNSSLGGLPPPRKKREGGITQRLTRRRIALIVLAVIGGWLALSFVLFMISAQIQSQNVSGAARKALESAGYPLTSPNTILVLGSDARTKNSKEPGAQSLPSRSDTIMLLRVGGGHAARLSIPRDTVVNIPGHGVDKINAAYAIGGPALTITTVEQYLGIEVNHLIEVNFENFPSFIDALGGVNLKTGCVVSKINGGFRNGGFTLRLRHGKNHLNGKQALALARTRKNSCNATEDDLTRARRQQKLLAAMKSRLLSPLTFFRLPWVAWQAPRAIRSDMSGPSLLGVFASMTVSGSGETRILKPSGGTLLPGGGAGLIVSDAERQAEVKRFLGD